jgi:hypothetical protein
MSRLKRLAPLLTITVATCAAIALGSAAASACPMCKDSVANTDPGVAAGFNNSIYFMLLGFFGCLGLVARTIIKGVRSSTVPPGFPVQNAKPTDAKPRPPQNAGSPADPPTDPDDRHSSGPDSRS